MRFVPYLRTLILGAGVISSWSTLAVQLRDFYAQYGTLWHASTYLVPNPLLTPCLYGSLAFLAALVWSGALQISPNPGSEVWLERLLLFGIVFAGVVVSYDCADYFHLLRFNVPIVCTPGVDPIFSPCFRGLIFFIAAYAASRYQRSAA